MFYVAFNDPGDRAKSEPLVSFNTRQEAREFALEESRKRWGAEKVLTADSGDIVAHLDYNEWCARVEEGVGGPLVM